MWWKKLLRCVSNIIYFAIFFSLSKCLKYWAPVILIFSVDSDLLHLVSAMVMPCMYQLFLFLFYYFIVFVTGIDHLIYAWAPGNFRLFIFFVGKLWFSSLSLTCCCDFDSLLLPIYFCVVSYVFLSKAFYVVSCVCHLCAFVVSKDFMFCILLLWILIQFLYYCVLSCIYESCVVSFIFCV